MEEIGKGFKKILVVDDNNDSRELVVKVLKNQGYEMIEAIDGEDALEKAVSEKPDLILMDISIPKLNGYEVTKRLKSLEEVKEIPVVALTAHAMKGDRAKAHEAVGVVYITPPINVRELPAQVKSYMRGKWESIFGGEKE